MQLYFVRIISYDTLLVDYRVHIHFALVASAHITKKTHTSAALWARTIVAYCRQAYVTGTEQQRTAQPALNASNHTYYDAAARQRKQFKYQWSELATYYIMVFVSPNIYSY